MALFNLLGGGIDFKNDIRSGTSRLLEENQYNQNLLRYPSDLGSADKGHYMVININEQIETSFPSSKAPDANTAPEIFKNLNALQQQFGATNVISAIKNFNSFFPNIGALNKISERVNSAVGIRTIRRITDTIAFYMPDNLNFNYDQSYSKIYPSSAKLSGTSSATETMKKEGSFNVANQFSQAAPFLINAYLKRFGDVGKVLFVAGSGGKVENPMMEILYSSPDLRSFSFDFLMTPRSEKEAEEVQKIISLLTFHQAPELVQNSGGFFMYPPSEFDISFYYNGKKNPNIPKISTCVLTGIKVDYAPGGFAAYEVEGDTSPSMGRTGMPVAIRLGLSFTETEYIVKGSPLLSGDNNNKFQKVVPPMDGRYGEENGVIIK